MPTVTGRAATREISRRWPAPTPRSSRRSSPPPVLDHLTRVKTQHEADVGAGRGTVARAPNEVPPRGACEVHSIGSDRVSAGSSLISCDVPHVYSHYRVLRIPRLVRQAVGRQVQTVV